MIFDDEPELEPCAIVARRPTQLLELDDGGVMGERRDVWLFPTRGGAEERAALLVTVSRRDATAPRARPL